jgi:hypothetical protein
MKIEEELVVDKQKKAISKVIQKLAGQDPNLYYTDSSTIASLVLQGENQTELNREEKELLQKLSVKDVLILMSYNSNCC